MFVEIQSGNLELKLITPKYIIERYFDTKLSMFGLANFATEEGAEGHQKGPPALCKSQEGAECPQLLVFKKYIIFPQYTLFFYKNKVYKNAEPQIW